MPTSVLWETTRQGMNCHDHILPLVHFQMISVHIQVPCISINLAVKSRDLDLNDRW